MVDLNKRDKNLVSVIDSPFKMAHFNYKIEVCDGTERYDF